MKTDGVMAKGRVGALARPARWGLAALLMVLTGCGTGVPVESSYPSSRNRGSQPVYSKDGMRPEQSSVFGQDGIKLFGSSTKDDPGGGGIGVNSYLWRASLDAIAFLPLASADPFGGVIITDWYAPPEAPAERYKLNVYILGRQLRADGIKASVFRQRRDAAGNWADAAVEAKAAIDLENAILTRARQLRIDTARP
ncbi:MAG: DUF3576 domain-containing protein [Pseudomonadota bacterium]